MAYFVWMNLIIALLIRGLLPVGISQRIRLVVYRIQSIDMAEFFIK